LERYTTLFSSWLTWDTIKLLEEEGDDAMREFRAILDNVWLRFVDERVNLRPWMQKELASMPNDKSLAAHVT